MDVRVPRVLRACIYEFSLNTRADALRKVQMVGAVLWIGYGVVMQAAPVITANVLCWARQRWPHAADTQLRPPSYGLRVTGYGLSAELRGTSCE